MLIPALGKVEEVLWCKGGYCLARMYLEGMGSERVLFPPEIRLPPAEGFTFSGFILESDGGFQAVRGRIYLRKGKPAISSLKKGPLLKELGGKPTPEALVALEDFLTGKRVEGDSLGEPLWKKLREALALPWGGLVRFGLPPSLAQKAYWGFGPGAHLFLAEEPYALMELFLPFAQVDDFWLEAGLDPNYPGRYMALCKGLLQGEARHKGATALSLEALASRYEPLFPFFLVGLSLAEERKEVYTHKGRVSLREWVSWEEGIVGFLHRKKRPVKAKDGNRDGPLGQVLDLLGKGSSLVVTGGAGTGKTTLIGELCQRVPGVLLLSPTGKGAHRLKETTGKEAYTIHSLLQRIDTLVDEKTQVVVVDEAGMVGTELFFWLVSALPPHLPLLLVGDPMQLPPVEVGEPFSHLLPLLPRVELNTIYRSKGKLTELALVLRTGSFKEEEFPWGEEVQRVVLDRLELMKQYVEGIMRRVDGRREVVLTPSRKGPFGTKNLNAVALKSRNLPLYPFSPGVPVVFVRNNPAIGYSNGEVDLVEAVREDGGLVLESGLALPAPFFQDLEPSYALTAHRGQGSEWEHVVVLVPPDGLGIMDRRWLYTASTRAKTSLKFVHLKGWLDRVNAKVTPPREGLLSYLWNVGTKK